MTKAKAKKPRPKKVVKSSWSADGPVTVTFEVAKGSLQHMWLRFNRPGFDGLVFTDLAAAERLHRELGLAIDGAKQELAVMNAAHAADLDASIPAHPNESQ